MYGFQQNSYAEQNCCQEQILKAKALATIGILADFYKKLTFGFLED